MDNEEIYCNVVTLSKEERDDLKEITCRGTHKSQQVLNAEGARQLEWQIPFVAQVGFEQTA